MLYLDSFLDQVQVFYQFVDCQQYFLKFTNYTSFGDVKYSI